MRFSTQSLIALLASPLLALAASTANPFNVPTGGYNVTAGTATTLTWSPTTSGTVSLILRSGASSDLEAGTYIAQSITNSGSYTWTPASSITRGSDYTVEIVDDTNANNTNYTPYFVIESTNTVASSTSDIALGAPTGSSTATGSSASSAASSAVSSAVSAISSASRSASSVVSSASSASSAAAASSSHTGSSSSTSATSSASSSASAASSATSHAAAAQTLFPAAGLMGVLALGAFAL